MLGISLEKGCVLVTGGAGFIGSFTVENLLLKGYEVSVLDDFSSGSMKNLEQVRSEKSLKVFRGNITKFDDVERAVRNVDFVVHEAAITSIQKSIEDPIRINEVNVTGTLNILKACLDSNVKRLVFASSCAVYGNPVKLPVSEDHSRRAISPYGVSKLSAEAYCLAFYETYGFETVVLRYFNVYGPRQGYNPYSGVITIFIQRLTEGKPPIIYGNGEQTRDFIYVEDVAKANLQALTSENAAGKTFNVGTGKATKICNLADTLMQLMNVRSKPVYEEKREADIEYIYAETLKATKILGFKAETLLKTGLRKTINTIK